MRKSSRKSLVTNMLSKYTVDEIEFTKQSVGQVGQVGQFELSVGSDVIGEFITHNFSVFKPKNTHGFDEFWLRCNHCSVVIGLRRFEFGGRSGCVSRTGQSLTPSRKVIGRIGTLSTKKDMVETLYFANELKSCADELVDIVVSR